MTRTSPLFRSLACVAAFCAAAGLSNVALGASASPTFPADPVLTGSGLADVSDYGWRAFIALNWPALAGQRGQPDTAKHLADPGPDRVWTSWKSRYELFQPGGVAPSNWSSYDGANPCGAGITNDGLTLSSFSAFADFNQAIGSLNILGNPLVAQNRTYVRYEIRVNEPQFDSIVRNQWYLANNLPTAQQPLPFDPGSAEVKAAWRVLTAADDAATRARYFVIKDAHVLDVTTGACADQDVALIGLHIVVKTPDRPQWLWFSFEHVDNVPNQTGAPPLPAGVRHSLHDPLGPNALVPTARPLPIDPLTNPPVASPAPMQVIRRLDIPGDVMAANQAYWALPEIAGSIWANYMLVSAQFPSAPSPELPSNDGVPSPAPGNGDNLANTTMETYFQRDFDSCMSCHQIANEAGRDFVMFVTMDSFRSAQGAPADPFSGKIFGDFEREQAPSLADDPLIQSLAAYFASTE